MNGQKTLAAVVQAAPVAFDRERTLEKVRSLAGDAARKGAQLALFPEAFVSAYPRGMDFGAVIGSRSDQGREDFRRCSPSSGHRHAGQPALTADPALHREPPDLLLQPVDPLAG